MPVTQRALRQTLWARSCFLTRMLRKYEDAGGKTEALPLPRRQEAAGRHGEPLLGRAGPHLWPAMWSLQICLLYIYCSVSDHRGKTEVPTFTSAHPSVSISTHRS